MSWSCQRCRQPLLLHPSVGSELDLNQSAYDLVQDSFIASRQPSRSAPTSRVVSLPDKNQGAPAQEASKADGVEASTADANSLSARLAASSALFDLLSHPPATEASANGTGSATVIDHPLCKACTDTLLDIMDAQMSQLRTQRDSYLAFESELRRYKLLPSKPAQRSSTASSAEAGPSSADDMAALESEARKECVALQREIAQLAEDEATALAELDEAETARLAVETELEAMRIEERALEQEEERFWSQYSSYTLTLSKLEDEKSSLGTSIAHDRQLLARLRASNVYTDAFCIGHSGGIATINGLRLGRLPGQAVEWNEINAAWGQTALLLDVIARKLGVGFRGYRLVPKGSFSVVYRYEDTHSHRYSASSTTAASSILPAAPGGIDSNVEEVDEEGEKAVYELYGSSDWQIGRLLQSRRFDHAQTGFLACLKQVVDFAGRHDAAFQTPHAINKDKIGEASIRLQFGSDETWTRALRHVLVTCNRVLMCTLEREKHQQSAHAGGVSINGKQVGSVGA